jgi:hypothetical protein
MLGANLTHHQHLVLGHSPLTPLEIMKGGSHKFLTNSHHLYPLISYLINL